MSVNVLINTILLMEMWLIAHHATSHAKSVKDLHRTLAWPALIMQSLKIRLVQELVYAQRVSLEMLKAVKP